MTFGFNRSHQAYGPNRVQLKEFSNSAAQHSNAAPFKVAIVYNQSAHAVKMVVDELRSEWGNTIKIIQVIGDNQAVSNVDASIKIDSGKWNDLDHFEDRLNQFKLQNPSYRVEIESKKTAFTAVWSGFAEAGSTGRKVEAMGLIWTGTTPDISDGLEKMGFKEFCDQVGAPTPEWFKLPNAENIDDSLRLISEKCTSGSWMIKSIFGGGGVGTKSFSDVKNISDVKSALKRVIGETKSAEGIYLEKKVDVKGGFYQGEFEVDGNQVAHGTRIVWFNANNAKVLEIGCQDEYIDQLGMPIELIQKIKDDSKKIAEISKNNTRGTIEALIYKTDLGEWAYTFIEMNRRPQVENEALAYLEMNPKTGLRRKTFVESFKRACGVPATPKVPSNVKFIAHGRILVGDPNSDGVITNHLGTIKGMSGPLPAYVEAESICEGEISATSNPQHGRVLISGQSFQDVCEKLATYFKFRKPVVDGVDSTYGEGLASIIGSESFKKGKISSNETFTKRDLPTRETSASTIERALKIVTDVMVDGYRGDEGVDPERFPTNNQIKAFNSQSQSMEFLSPSITPFTQFCQGQITYDEYIDRMQNQLSNLGGGWGNVAPRDTRQQAGDSESASIVYDSKRIAEQFYVPAGLINHEVGGAQYQAGLLRGFNPWAIMEVGLSSNIMTSALIRSQWLNGLSELPADVRDIYFQSIADGVRSHFCLSSDKRVPMTFNNFHAGNFFNELESPQDDTTIQMLKAGLIPRPNWVFSSKFPLKKLEEWVHRQINLFEENGHKLREVRIKNPGQGLDYTADSIWQHIQVIRKVFKERGLIDPIIFLHNHDFNGRVSHDLLDVIKRGQADNFPFIVVDAAYRKSGTHADNTIITSALNLTAEQQESLLEGNRQQQLVESLTTRFDSGDSQMTPWDSDWAGGTEGSDIRIAKEYGLTLSQIEQAKRVATVVFEIERAVTPFSEYKLRLGIAIMIESGIPIKNKESVIDFINKGGKLTVGGDVLLGLEKWQTLIPKPAIVNQLLQNMSLELETAKKVASSPIMPKLTDSFADKLLLAGFQQKGLEYHNGDIPDRTPLIFAPHVLHAKPGTLPKNTPFKVRLADGKVEDVIFKGRSLSDDGQTFSLSYVVNGKTISIEKSNPNQQLSQKSDGPRLAKENEFGIDLPGEVVSIDIEPGDVIKEGQSIATIESMKMQMQITAPSHLVGQEVERVFPSVRTSSNRGDILPKNGALFSYRQVRSFSTFLKGPVRYRAVAGAIMFGARFLK